MNPFAELLCNHGDGHEVRRSEALAIGDVARVRARKRRACASLLELEALRWEARSLIQDYYETDQFSLPGVE